MNDSDKLFCELGKRLGKITNTETNKALEKQKVDRALGCNKPIGAYLVEAGALTKDDVLLILKEQEKQKSNCIANIKNLLTKFSGNLAGDNVYFAPNLPTDKAINAIKSYGKEVQLEGILMLVDETFFGSSTDGFLLTESGLYCKNQNSLPWAIKFENIKSIKFETTFSSRTLVFNDYFQLTTNIFGEKQAKTLFKIINAAIKGVSTDLQPVITGSKQDCVTAGNKINQYQKLYDSLCIRLSRIKYIGFFHICLSVCFIVVLMEENTEMFWLVFFGLAWLILYYFIEYKLCIKDMENVFTNSPVNNRELVFIVGNLLVFLCLLLFLALYPANTIKVLIVIFGLPVIVTSLANLILHFFLTIQFNNSGVHIRRYKGSFDEWLASINNKKLKWEAENKELPADLLPEFSKVYNLTINKNLNAYRKELEKLRETIIATEDRIAIGKKNYEEFDENTLKDKIKEVEARSNNTKNETALKMLKEQKTHYINCMAKIELHKESLELYQIQKETILSSLKHLRLRLLDNEKVSVDEITLLNKKTSSIHDTMNVMSDVEGI